MHRDAGFSEVVAMTYSTRAARPNELTDTAFGRMIRT